MLFIDAFLTLQWHAAIGVLVSVFLGAIIVKRSFPPPAGSYFRDRIRSSLATRLGKYQAARDTDRARGISLIISNLDQL